MERPSKLGGSSKKQTQSAEHHSARQDEPSWLPLPPLIPPNGPITGAPKTSYALIFYNGSFTPVHVAHLDLLRAARSYIESQTNYEMLGAVMSISHSAYLTKKLGEERIGLEHRVSMCELALQELGPWARVDRFESSQPQKPSIFKTLEHFAARVERVTIAGKPVKVERAEDSEPAASDSSPRVALFWCMGEDGLWAAPPAAILSRFHMLQVFNRAAHPDTSTHLRLRAASPYPHRFHLVTAPSLDRSSTAIRSACAAGNWRAVESLVGIRSVSDYIISRGLWNSDLLSPGAAAAPNVRHGAARSPAWKEIPHAENEVSVATLSALLGAPVTSFAAPAPTGTGRGFGGPIARVHSITYDQSSTPLPPSSLPTSVILKFTTGLWNNRETKAEALLFVTLAPRVSSLRLPICYSTSTDPLGAAGVLALEDLTHCTSVAAGRPPVTIALIERVIKDIAAFHAEWWGPHPVLDRLSWMLPHANAPAIKDAVGTRYRLNLRAGRALLQAHASAAALALAESLATNVDRLLDSIATAGPASALTLCHGDLWVQNLLFMPPPADDTPGRPVFLDWQTVCIGLGALDVAFLIHSSLDPALVTKQSEARLLDLYLASLQRCGVSYTRAALEADFKCARQHAFVMMMLGVGAIRNPAAKPSAKWRRILHCLERAVESK